MALPGKRLEPWATDHNDLPSHGLARGPWQAAPLPTGIHDTADELSESDLSGGLSDSRGDSPSQVSESTHPLTAASEETRVIPRPEDTPVPAAGQPQPQPAVTPKSLTLVLAWVVPLSILLGALAATLIIRP